MYRFTVMLVVVALFFSLAAYPAGADNAGLVKIDDSIEVLEQTMSIPEKGIPTELLSNASGIAIIPGVIKAGFILGGRYGKGVLVIREKDGSWSNPVFITIAGGSIGWQIGVESIDIILVFKTSRSIEGIMRGKFTLGADASIAAGPVGRQASASTDVMLKSEIYSYSRSRGLFAGLALDGAGIQIDHDADEGFYGKGYALPTDIIGNKELKAPPVVDRLKKLLDTHSSAPATVPEKGGRMGQEKGGRAEQPASPEKTEKIEEKERPVTPGPPSD